MTGRQTGHQPDHETDQTTATASPLPAITWWRSIRARVAGAVVAITVSVLVPTSILVDVLAAQQARERLRQSTLRELDNASVSYLVNGKPPVGTTYSIDAAPNALKSALRNIGSTATYYDGKTMWAARSVPAIGIQIGEPSKDAAEMGEHFLVMRLPAQELTDQRHDLLVIMSGTGMLGVILAGALGWIVASRSSQQLRLAAQEASQLDVHNPKPLTKSESHDEVAVLTAAVNNMTQRLVERAAAEKEFSARVAHELRTPTTALLSASELLPDTPESGLIRRGVHRLQKLIEDLLELFRAEHGINTTTGLTLALDTATAKILDDPQWAGLDVRGTLAGSETVVEAARLERALSNIIRNAQVHGQEPIVVELQPDQIRVIDSGTGFPEWIVTEGPTAFRRESDQAGTGLGLAIAHQQLTALGAEVRYCNVEGSGACVEIRFGRPAVS